MMKTMKIGSIGNRGGSPYILALGLSLALVASLSAPNAEANKGKVTVKDAFVDTEVTFEFIDSISRGRLEGTALSASRYKGFHYSNNSGVVSGSEAIKLHKVMAQSLPDHCVTLAARAIGSEDVLFSVTARIYSIKDGKQIPRPVMAFPMGVEKSDDLGELIGCKLISGSTARVQPVF